MKIGQILFGIVVLIYAQVLYAERIKDLVSIAGVRSNQLVGYGLVVGLNGSGDQTSQTPFTVQSLKNMLHQFGITVPPNINPQLKNVAAVSVHAELPAFTKPGQTIDITASSIGNAKSLRGGTLLITPLKGINGQVYAIAQGNLVVGGLGVEGSDGSKITVNIPSVGRIPNGAIVERAVDNPFNVEPFLVMNLHNADFTTAHRVADTINHAIGMGTANAMDAISIQINAPRDSAQKVAYISYLENLSLEPGRSAARIVVNSRTGTVVVGQNVRVYPAAVSHGSLTVTIKENLSVSQPNPLAEGETVVIPQSELNVNQKNERMFLFESTITLQQIVQAINKVGVAPGDLVAILEALKSVGALRAELIII